MRHPRPSQKAQKAEPFVEPPRDVIPTISRHHVAAMEESDADDVWVVAGMQHVILCTIGRKTGAKHKVALPVWKDQDGHPIVVASFAGSPQDPAWYRNLTDRRANPEVLVRAQGRSFWARAEVLSGDAYRAAWAALTADRDWYLDYQTRTERRIPLVKLIEARAA